MGFLEKIRNQSETRKKIIFWSIIIIIGLGLLLLYFKNIQNNIEKLKSIDFKEELKMQDFRGELKNLPKIEIPEIGEQEIKKNEEKESSTTSEEASATE